MTRATLVPAIGLLALVRIAPAQPMPPVRQDSGGISREGISRALSRLSEEAEAFHRLAPKVIGRETLRHKGRQAPSRLRWFSSRKAPEVSYRTAEIVSEYGFGHFAESPDDLREFRQVVSVDGRARVAAATRDARQVLAENMASDDDRLRRRLLEDFEKYGQTGSATDFGQMILLFRRRSIENYDFAKGRDVSLEGEPCLVIRWAQRPGVDPLHVYSKAKLQRIPMAGEIWFRARDLMPLRITMSASLDEEGVPVVYSAEIDYERSRYGLVLPSALHFEKQATGILLIDNHSSYGDYQMFGANSQIVFEEAEPDAETAPQSGQ